MTRKPEDNHDFQQRLHMLLDNELNQEAEKELMEEINNNPTYKSLLKKEKSFIDFIRNTMPRKKASPVLVQSLKNKINDKNNGLENG